MNTFNRLPVPEGTKVFYRSPNFVIYEELKPLPGKKNDKGPARFSRTVEYKTLDDALYNTYAISIQLVRFQLYLEDTGLERSSYNDGVADAIYLCFMNRPDEALKIMALLETESKNEVYKWSKLYYLVPCVLLVAVLGLGTLILLSYKLALEDAAQEARFKLFYYCGTLGALGGLLSIARSMDSYNIEIKRRSSFWKAAFVGPHLAGICTRFIVAILGGVTVVIIEHSGLINLGQGATDNRFILYLLAIVAGFSQNLIPGLLTRFETNVNAGEPVRVLPTGELATPRPAIAAPPLALDRANATTPSSSSQPTAAAVEEDEEAAVG